jgi:hypothetical protein
MSFSETGGIAGELPPLPPGFKVPGDWDEALLMMTEADFSREAEDVGRRWYHLQSSLEHVDSTFGTDDDLHMSYHSTGGERGRRVLVRSFDSDATRTISTWRRRTVSTEAIPAWNIVVNDWESDEQTEVLQYREFTLLRGNMLNITRLEERANWPGDRQWAYSDIGRCALLTPLDGICYVDRGAYSQFALPPSAYVIPGNIEAVKDIGRRVDEVQEIVNGLSAGTHEEEIVSLKEQRG